MQRRQFFRLVTGTIALPAVARFAWAEVYPTRPVRLLVSSPPGGTADFLGRVIGQWLYERLGQPFVIENKGGSGNTLAADAVAKAPADGYTLLMINPAHALNATLYDKLDFNLSRDITPVAGLVRAPNVM
jgi:tripartite-type tricarboxylate transporter receptor subunit TctC